jgi:ribosomal protein S7
MIEDRIHDVSITVFDKSDEDFEPRAEIETHRYPDGSVKNSLSVEDVRGVAAMLLKTANQMEEE